MERERKKREEKVSAVMQISDRTRPLLSVPNPRAGSGNDMRLDEMNDERDKEKKKNGAAMRQKDGVHARIKRNLDPSANICQEKRVQTDVILAVFPPFGPSDVLL